MVADGSLVDASDSGDRELLWGLRGGGAGFGVVVEATYRTHQLQRVLSVVVGFSLDTAAPALLSAQGLLDDHPDELSILPLVTFGPDQIQVLLLVALWTGERSYGERIARALGRLAGAEPLSNQWIPYARSFSPGDDELWRAGKWWYTNTATVPRIDQDVARVLVELAQNLPRPGGVIWVHDFHGAPTRVNPATAAFPLRRNHLVIGAAGYAEPGDRNALRRGQDWADELPRRLENSALPGGYINFLAPADSDRVRAGYGEALPRLTALRARVDPHHLFTGAVGAF